ncbi:YdeI/OmpD-associated family protein [Paractinoplanes globisporus]|uniref:YdeI/OmpD-associated family protein n=1 Tax=Paractinoplanes globisporus TaxID=113565 RepID=A0ABW6WIH5_9ACTN|nr:YdeI/OmpD-associated family protein [Actinoplanes globisporus]
MRLTVELQRTGGNTTGFQIPDEFVAELGGGGRPKVAVTVNGFTFRSSIAKMGGTYWLGVSGERRTAAGIEGGQVYDLDIELDTAPRVIETPEDLRAALDAEPAAGEAWQKLSYSHQRQHVEAIASAKTPETRARRVAKALEMLRR